MFVRAAAVDVVASADMHDSNPALGHDHDGHDHGLVALSGGYHAQVFTLVDGWYATLIPAGHTGRDVKPSGCDHIAPEITNRVGPCMSRESLQQNIENLAQAFTSQKAATNAAENLAAEDPDIDDETLAEKLMELGFELEESWAAAAFTIHAASAKAAELV